MIGAGQRDMPEAPDAVGLARTLPDPAIERQRLLIGLTGGIVIGAGQRDSAQAPDAVGLAQHIADGAEERQRLLKGLTGSGS